MNKSKCKSCGAAIIWAETMDGQPLPLNATRVRQYEVVDSSELRALVDTRCGDDGRPDLVYISHFVSCPNASQHSKRGGS